MKNLCFVIPSLQPEWQLIPYIQELSSLNIQHIIIVDDGSGKNYQSIFHKINQFDNCTVLTHEINKGKGAALKTAYQYIKDNLKDIKGIVCLDSDGQHQIKDVKHIGQELLQNPNQLILGERNFSFSHVPIKSWIGNRFSSLLFSIFCFRWIPDTQTGLRAFGAQYLDEMLQYSGERFEYESQVLIDWCHKKYPLSFIPIKTIYNDGNKGTHFKPIQDSLKILGLFFRTISLFISSAVVCFIIDFLAFMFFLRIFDDIVKEIYPVIILSTVLARIISMVCNFLINKKIVFQSSQQKHSFIKYLALCFIIMFLSAGFVSIFYTFGFPRSSAKILIDTLLSILSYQAQKRWVFNTKEG